MELEGSLKAFKFPEILQFLAMGRMTGILWLTQPDREVGLTFNEGKIIGASSEDQDLKLGQMLVNGRHLTRQALDELLQAQDVGESRRFLGEILVESAQISAETLRAVIKLQIEEIVWELFRWDAGNFRFEQGPVRDAQSLTVSLEVEPLLLEGSRRVDEWEAIASTITDPNEVYRVNPDLAGRPESALDLTAWRVLSIINGRLPVESLVRMSNLGKFETYWALENLLRSELIVSTGERAGFMEDEAAGRRASGAGGSPEGEAAPKAGSADGGAGSASILGLFGRRKGAPAESRQVAAAAAPPAEVAGVFRTNVALACQAVNQLLDLAESQAKAFSSGEAAGAVAQLWRAAENRFPKADLVQPARGKLSSRLYDRYAELAGGYVPALSGAHDDCLEAIKAVWAALRAKLRERADAKTADQLARRAIEPLLERAGEIQPPDFSLKRWHQDVG